MWGYVHCGVRPIWESVAAAARAIGMRTSAFGSRTPCSLKGSYKRGSVPVLLTWARGMMGKEFVY